MTVDPFKALTAVTVSRCGSVRFTSYDSTRGNMFINKSTKVICQGFTGKQVVNCRHCIELAGRFADKEVHCQFDACIKVRAI